MRKCPRSKRPCICLQFTKRRRDSSPIWIMSPTCCTDVRRKPHPRNSRKQFSPVEPWTGACSLAYRRPYHLKRHIMENTVNRAIAIVGVGAILPDAPNVPAFWNNVKTGRYSVAEVPADRWNPASYFDADPTAPDKTYSKIGG